MKILLKIKKHIPYILLFILVLFNLYLYSGEFNVLTDPNDNTFHYALIDDAKQVWEEVFKGKLSPVYLLDSWNERWAEGFSLSQYYSHLPEAVISLISFIVPISTFKLFVIIRTLLLILLPVSFFLGAVILGYSPTFGVIFAFFSQAIFTDGLYGLDSPSFLWRGWGLSTQLMAVFFLPLAFAYGVRYFKIKKDLGKAILFNFILAQSHFGMFYLLLFAYPVFWIFSLEKWKEIGKRILTFLLLTLISLSYFIVPFFTTSQYRNFSLWDPIWKFNSWGLNQIIIWLLNGDLFDFNRFPFLTILIIGGVFWGLVSSNKFNRYLVLVFGSYFILFLGRDVLGPLINFIPGMNEYHIHRVIVMIQFFGLLIASGWVFDLIQRCNFRLDPRLHGGDKKGMMSFPRRRESRLLISFLIIVLGCYSIYLIEKPIINYVKDNDVWIARSNDDYQKNINDYQTIVDRLRKLPPARVYAGRPGNWGRNFKIGDTQIYMALSSDGFPIIGFLPQSWSPNSDAEQFFDEENPKHYDLYNVGYIVLPADKKAPQFAKLIISKGRFSLYKVESEGWFTIGKSSLQVETDKNNLVNIAHLWFYSPMFTNKDYPVISLNNEKDTFVESSIKMSDQSIFDGNKAIWRENPMFGNQEKFEQKLINKTEKNFSQEYSVNFKLENKCQNCVIILKQTFHPNWEIKVNGKRQKAFPVFPFFIGIKIDQPGNYQVNATYKPSYIKILLLFLTVIIFILTFKYLKNKLP